MTYVFQCFQGDRVDEADRSEVQDDGVCVFLHTAGGVCLCVVLLWLEAVVHVTVGYCRYAVVIDDVFMVRSLAVHRFTRVLLHGEQQSVH